MTTVIDRIFQVIDRYPPDGKYKGTWSGYEIRFEDNKGDTFEGRALNGIRGTVACEVTIENGNGSFSAKPI
jgi:hypothetical protein